MKAFNTLSILLCLLIGLVTERAQAWPQSGKRHDLMATAGDSISAAFIANTTTSRPEDPSNVDIGEDSASRLISVNYSGQPFSLRLWLAQFFNHKYTFSWGTGLNVQSHYVRVREIISRDEPNVIVDAKNVAFSGATSSDLSRQAKKIVASWRLGNFENLRYVTLLIGANDICFDHVSVETMPSVTIDSNIRAFFKELSKIKQKEPIRVVMSALPRIPDIGQPEVLNHVLPSGKTCAYKLYQQDRLCNGLSQWNTPQEYAARIAVVEKMNSILKNLSMEMQHVYPQFQIAYSEQFYHRKIVVEKLARDCFHPNRLGQDEISAVLWADQPWWHDQNGKNSKD